MEVIMTTRKEIENLHESSGSKKAAALGYLLGYGTGGVSQLHMCCRTQVAMFASATALFDFLDDNPGVVEKMVEWVLDEGRDAEGNKLTDEVKCEGCGEPLGEDGICEECDACDACVARGEEPSHQRDPE